MSYSIHVQVFSLGTTYALDVPTGNDVKGDVAAAYGLADPLTITQALNGDPRLPLSHPVPAEASFNLIAPNASAYGAMQLGDPVAIQVYPQAGYAGTPDEFYGRINSLVATPHDLGIMLAVGCIDYLADLAEVYVGFSAYPKEKSRNRVNRAFNEGGVTVPSKLAPWSLNDGPDMAARSASKTDLLSITLDTLDSWIESFDTGGIAVDETGGTISTVVAPDERHIMGFRGILKQNITSNRLDVTTPYSVCFGATAGQTRRQRYAPPARLTNVAGVRTVTVAVADSNPSTGAPIIDGGEVEFAPVFTQSKAGALPNVTAGSTADGSRYEWDWRTRDGWNTGGGIFGPGGLHEYGVPFSTDAPAVIQEVDSIIDVAWDSPFPGSTVAQMYRTPFRPDQRIGWLVGTMAWQVWRNSAWRRPQLTELLTVARVVGTRLPFNREWVSGLVVGTKLTVANGRPVLEIDTVPNSYDHLGDRRQLGSSLGVVSMDSPILSGVTLAQLNARDSLDDYALVRGS